MATLEYAYLEGCLVETPTSPLRGQKNNTTQRSMCNIVLENITPNYIGVANAVQIEQNKRVVSSLPASEPEYTESVEDSSVVVRHNRNRPRH